MTNFYESIYADTVNVRLNYGEKEKDYIFGQPSEKGNYEVAIHNARKYKNKPQLGREGFCKVEENSGYNDFTNENENEIRESYFPIVRESIKQQLMDTYQTKNCDIYIFHYYIRNENSTNPTSVLNRTPVELVHADYSTARLNEFYTNTSKDHLFQNACGNHKDIIGNKNWGLFNVWKPINLIINSNLALCAKNSLKADDICRHHHYIKFNQISRQSSLHYSKNHRWFYYPLMQPNEMLIFEQYKNDFGFNNFIPVFHTAFNIDKSLSGYSPRQSIEFRMLAVWE